MQIGQDSQPLQCFVCRQTVSLCCDQEAAPSSDSCPQPALMANDITVLQPACWMRSQGVSSRAWGLGLGQTARSSLTTASSYSRRCLCGGVLRHAPDCCRVPTVHALMPQGSSWICKVDGMHPPCTRVEHACMSSAVTCRTWCRTWCIGPCSYSSLACPVCKSARLLRLTL